MNTPEASTFRASEATFARRSSTAQGTTDTALRRVAVAGPLATNPPIAILGVPFDNIGTAHAIQLIEEMIASRKPHYLVTANVDFVVQAQSDIELRRIIFNAELVLCDGTPLVWASRFLGNPLPERVAGADLVPLLIRLAAIRNYRIFLLGATPEAAEKAVARLRAQYPKLVIDHYSPPFDPLLEMDHEQIKNRITAMNPDMLFVSFGCPKQEKWIAMHYKNLSVPVVAGVGATIDFLAGQVRRSPVWMQKIGAEWIFRLAQEPRRLFGRYARDLWVFGKGIVKQWWQLQFRHRLRPATPQHNLPPTAPSTVLSAVTEELVPIKVRGRLDSASAHDGTFALDKILSRSGHCLLQMEDVEFIDSTGIGILVQLQKRLHGEGRQLVFIAPSTMVTQALMLMRLTEFFAIAADLEAAKRLVDTRQHELPVVADSVTKSEALHWQGEITAENAEHVWDSTVAWLANAGCDVQQEAVINLAAVRFIDSSGLAIMIRARKLAQRHGVNLKFQEIQPAVRNVIRISRMEEFLGLCDAS